MNVRVSTVQTATIDLHVDGLTLNGARDIHELLTIGWKHRDEARSDRLRDAVFDEDLLAVSVPLDRAIIEATTRVAGS